MNELLAQLESALKRHDWYYDYSDDHRVWSSGEANRKLIQELNRKLQIEGQGEVAKALYNRYSPHKKAA